MPTQSFQGIVVKRAGDKTVAVEVHSVRIHPLYHKRIARTRRLLAHDPLNAVAVGQTVKLQQSRPHSRRKHWTIIS